MAVEAIDPAAAKQNPIALLTATDPGAFGITDRVEQGTPFRGDPVWALWALDRMQPLLAGVSGAWSDGQLASPDR